MSCVVCVGGFGELGLGIINGKKKGNEKDKKTIKTLRQATRTPLFFLSFMVCLSC